MPAIFDRCPACLAPTQLSEEKRQFPIAVYKACPRCNWWHRLIRVSGLIILAIAVCLTAINFIRSDFAAGISASGIILTIVGGYLMFGRLELLIMIAGVLGGLTVYDSDIAENTKKARIGLILILLGLLLQVVGSVALAG